MKYSRTILSNSEKILRNSEKILRNSEKILRNELFLDNLNDIFINSLNDFLFLDDVFEMINLINWDVLDVSIEFSLIDKDLNCSYLFLLFSSHFAKFVVSLITILMTVLKNFWFNAQSIETKSFSLMYLKNLTMSRSNCLLENDNFCTAEKSELFFTKLSRRWVCLIMWLLSDCMTERFYQPSRLVITWPNRDSVMSRDSHFYI